MGMGLAIIIGTLFVMILSGIITCTRTCRSKEISSSNNKQPPAGSKGWPLIGETLALLGSLKQGTPERFIRERIDKYHSPEVFKTNLLGVPTAVLCGEGARAAEANKLLFANENKVRVWWPPSVHRLFGSCLITATGNDAKRMRRILLTCLGPDALTTCLPTLDTVTHLHISSLWQGRDQVTVYPTVKLYTFELACRLFMSIENPQHITRLSTQFNVFLKGVIQLPINLPGTRFRQAMTAASAIRKELADILRQRKLLHHNLREKISSSKDRDLISHLLVTSDEDGGFLTETEIINNILLLLFAGHDTSSSVITLLLKYLGEFPHVYERVLAEQMEIAKTKGQGEVLQWEDIQKKMRYSWQVVSEVMRLTPPIAGGFREVLSDISYAGYTIPKGWNIYWSAAATHRDAALFPDSTKFDPSRFEGAGPPPFTYVPFGGGPRMCLGKEFARLEILVFLHYIIICFKWELMIPGENIEYDPMATPVNGLPIRLIPHNTKVM